MGTEPVTRTVVMFPWLAYGHITPFLGLAKTLSHRGFLIYICSTPVNLNSIKNMIPHSYSASINLVELHLPQSTALPPHYQTTKGLPLHLHDALKEALKMAQPHLTRILERLNPDLLIYDVVQLWAERVASSLNIPSVRFSTAGAAFLSYLVHIIMEPGAEYPFPDLRLRLYEENRAREMCDQVRGDFVGLMEDASQPMMLINSSREIESKVLDYLSKHMKYKIVCVGSTFKPAIDRETEETEALMDWLGLKTANSTVFISFGSEYFLSKEDREEIAYGLELSRVDFIWVLRFPQGQELTVQDALPQDFLEKVGNRGRIVEGWAPQVKILSHPSTGFFVSHCGWNSILETLNLGVPMIAMPMHLDQPMNARLMVDLGVAVEIQRDDNGFLHREDIAERLREVVGGKTGEKLKKDVMRICEKLRMGANKEMEEAAAELVKLCPKQS